MTRAGDVESRLGFHVDHLGDCRRSIDIFEQGMRDTVRADNSLSAH